MTNSWVGHQKRKDCIRLTIDRADNEIVGEALIALRHEELKEMGIVSIGHRLTILKAVYDVKIRHDIPIDSDHWIPPCELIWSLYVDVD